jgi:group I intron endonuclease
MKAMKHMSNRQSGVYKIRNLINENIYVGSSVNLVGRLRDHRSMLIKNNHHNVHLQNAWNKYGGDAFAFEIIEFCEGVKLTLIAREQHYIDTLNPNYNIARKAYSTLGIKATQETREKISKATKGKPKKGTPRTEEQKRKMSEMRKGQPSARKGKSYYLDDKTREKIGSPWRDKTLPIEMKNKMSESRKGKTRSEESKKKISDSVKNSHLTPTDAMVEGQKISRVKKSEWRWITNGIDNKRVHISTLNDLPGEFYLGRTNLVS